MASRLPPLLRLPRWGSSALARVHLHSLVQPQPTAPQWVNNVPPPRARPQLPEAPEAVPPRTLSTAEGYVRLPQDGCLDGYTTRQAAAAELRGLPTVLLDGVQKSELEAVRQEIIAYFHATFTLFERLHEVFAVSTAFFEKHERLRHPPIFYLGHTASFFVNKLHLGRFITERIDPVLEMQMAVGVDEMSWDDLDTSKYVWPSVEEAEADVASATAFLQKVLDFRRDVRALVHREMERAPLEWPISRDSFWWVVLMGIEHERIHLETSSVILRQARLEQMQDLSKLLPQCRQGRFHPDPKSSVARSTPANQLVPVAAGATRIGRPWQGTSTYGWDNEFGKQMTKEVPAFAASEFLVSNFEFLSFMEAGGYSTERWWTEEGWNWVKDMQPTTPRFWRAEGGGYRLRTLFEELPMPWDWPVECNHHEAAAFCKFLAERSGKSLRLPSECEAMRLRDAEPSDLQDSAHGPSWGRLAPANVNLAHWGSPCPVDTFATASGHYDVLGNVWQHSLSPVDILDGFAAHPLYEDFTVPTVDGLHSRIMGGSWISTGAAGATRDSRFGFRRHFYQHAGFRYVESDQEVATGVTPCERDKALCNAFRFHFDAPGDSFAKELAGACVRALAAAGTEAARARALELGCGPGRTVLELAKLGVGAVHGADLTAKHFQLTSERLLAGGQLRWSNYLEGDLVEHRDLSCHELGMEGREAAVQWHQIPDFAAVDAKKFKDYDLVVCAQPGALCSSDPMGLLAGAHELLKPGGVLVLGTQYEWPSHVEGLQSGRQVLSASLQPWFEELAEPEELAFQRAETARKFECGTQELSFWRRRATQQHAPSSTTLAAAPAAAAATAPQSIYESNEILSQYLEFHFGPESAYPAACAGESLAAAKELNVPLQRALEVGCGPGRAALELSKAFQHVDAGDSSRAFVEVAQRLLEEGELRWRVVVDATAGVSVERGVTLQELNAGRVHFAELDAHNLGDADTGYDLICGFNLVDRLTRPRDFLQAAVGRLNAGGLLVLSSPYTWLEDFTAKDAWLGGYKYGDNDGPSTYRGLKELLSEQGLEEALAPKELWFRINELGNGRKSQQTRAQMTFWRRP